MCGTAHKTVKRVVERTQSGGKSPERKPGERNFDSVAGLVAERVTATKGRISAKRLLPTARVAGYEGSPRNFRRLVADAKDEWRRGNRRGRRPAVWLPGEVLAIDWAASGRCTCSAPCWRGRGSGSSGSR